MKLPVVMLCEVMMVTWTFLPQRTLSKSSWLEGEMMSFV